MTSVLDGVNQRTRLVGNNRMELLLFRLTGKLRYGINVFKVQEVIQCPSLTRIPNSHSVVCGIANIRGKTISIIDLGAAVGQVPLDNVSGRFVIIAEYNRCTIGFMVSSVDRIVNLTWGEIIPPPKASGKEHFLTAVTRVDDELVEILDVEKVLVQVMGERAAVSDAIVAEQSTHATVKRHIMVVDDSSVARSQIKRTLDRIGIDATMAVDGKQAWDALNAMANLPEPVAQQIGMIICDVEMPNMDGYTLTSLIKKDARFKDIYVLLHTSLSGVFNGPMVEKVGADAFVPKFEPNELAQNVLRRFEMLDRHADARLSAVS